MEIDKQQEDIVEVDTTDLPTTPPNEEEKYEPRGAFVFVIIMGIFYLIYWFVSWYEIFVARGS